MTTEEFNKVIAEQMDRCKDILCIKAEEYATQDRLHNFKNAAGMQGCSPKEALAGMMAKHTISIYDMCRDGKPHSIEMWDEKITDHINYLLLLKAVVEDERKDTIQKREIGTFVSAPQDCCTIAPPYDPKKYASYCEAGGTDSGAHTHILSGTTYSNN